MTDEIIKLINETDLGAIKIPNTLYMYLIENKYEFDADGNRKSTGYRASKVIHIVKYNNNRVNIAYVDLYKSDSANVSKDKIMDMNWEHLVATAEDLKDIPFSKTLKELEV